MKNKQLFIWVTISLLIVLAFSTNPPVEKHRAEVKNKFGTILQKSIAKNIDKNGGDKQGLSIGSTFSSMFGSIILNPLIDSYISDDNYLLFSVTRLKWNEKSNVIGIGVFGKVYITDNLGRKLE